MKRHYLAQLGLTVGNLARALNVSRKTMSKILNERASVTPRVALRLARAFNTTPELWMNLQRNVDLWQAKQRSSVWKEVPVLWPQTTTKDAPPPMTEPKI